MIAFAGSHHRWRLAAWAAFFMGSCFAGISWADDAIDYSTAIRPILSKKCFACHGRDAKHREADLRLDTREGALAEGSDGPAIVPGDSAASQLYVRITSDDPEVKMPPTKSNHKLTTVEIARLRRWIEQDAPYAEHWSFIKPVRAQPPEVRNKTWPRDELDRFILARLERAGLRPSVAADRPTLLRRLALDLTGIPPTLEQVDAFVKDESAGAYETHVDRLLASARFGEHWARLWLDLARYADTKGYEKDQPRNIWRYRDWVIAALNADMPYDQFTLEQLAGDLLPDATSDQILATAMHRNTMNNDEGGTDDEEFRVAAVKDRVDTTMQVWMGLTMGCAKCHSHKYDPISIEDYYRFYGFFNQTEDADKSNDHPLAATPTHEQQERRDALQAERARLQAALKTNDPAFVAARTKWEQQLRNAAEATAWTTLHPATAASEQGATLTVLPDGAVLASGKTPERDVYTITAKNPLARITAIRLEALTDPSLGRNGPGRNAADPNFVVNEFSVSTAASPQPIKLGGARADFSQNGWKVAGAIDGVGKTGWAISPQFGRPHVAIFDLAEPLASASKTPLTIRISQQYGNKLVLGKLRLSISDADVSKLTPQSTALSDLAAIPAARRTAAQQQQLDAAFRGHYPLTASSQKRISAIDAELAALAKAYARTPVLRELPANRRRQTNVHVRGNFLEKGVVVEPAVPAAFGALPEGAAANRLAMARWLVAADNPLTARVAVNRVWARLFGRGIVETEEDFGMQGMPPSHPRLLDWLAVEYRETYGWSLKRLCKTIVMSNTYRQASVVDEAEAKIDPTNVLLARGVRFRLSAETVRDQALAAAGLLSDKMFGASVMPPQPPGIWQATYSKLKWKTSAGDDRYRRGLYTFLRRTSPYPSMLTFDAGSREVCLIRRVRTNTPLQALVTLNDTVFVEAAGALARRMVSELPDGGPAARAERGFRLVLIRAPAAEETARLVALYEAVRAEYAADHAAAKALLAAANVNSVPDEDVVELASWTAVGNVLLNLDETMTRP